MVLTPRKRGGLYSVVWLHQVPQRFLRRGSVEGCIELVGSIEYYKLAASSTVKDSYAMEVWNNFCTMEVWKGFLRCGSAKDCTEWLATLITTKDSYALEVENFQHHGSVESCIELVGSIKYHKRIPMP